MRTRPLAALFALVLLALPAAWALGDRPASVTVGSDRIDLRFAFPVPTFGARDGAVEPQLGTWQTQALAPGEPLLPVAYVTVVLPPGTRAASVSLDGALTELPGRFRVAQGQQPQPLSMPPLPRTPPSRVYDSDELYPAAPVTITGGGFLHGYRVATLAIRPLALRPQSGRLYLRGDARVTLRLAADGALGFAAPRGLAADLAELARVAVNPETGAAYTPGLSAGARSADVPYLVVTTAALAPAFERLAAYRTAHGMPGEVLTLESIRAAYPGRDDAEKVRGAIGTYYRDHGTSFALLGGDDALDDGTPLVPVRYCAPFDNMTSDYYFGALDGDWDTNGNGTFCETAEVDYYTEVHIGRATVDTLAEANHFVDKVILFEDGLAEERRTDVTFFGENLDASTWGDDSKERIAPMIRAPLTLERRYGRDETFSGGNVIESLNRGPHLVNHDGHAGADYVMGIGIGNVEALTNASLFFGYSIGCYSGAFDQPIMGGTEAISEHFLLAPHAAVAVVMNSRYGWYYVGGTSGLSADYDYYTFDALLNRGILEFGAANDQSRADCAGSAQSNGTWLYCFLETNLHGDPATRAQLRAPSLAVAGTRVIEANPVFGNANGSADPGETVQVAVTLSNGGAATATGIVARLASATPGVAVHDARATWPDLAAGASAESAAPYFSATITGACGMTAAFRLEVTHDGVSEVSMITIPVGTVSETTLRADDFEAEAGWTKGGDSTQGRFIRANPNPTSDPVKGQVQPDDDHTPGAGSMCFVTGNPVTGDPTTGDINGGGSWLMSPAFDGRGEGRVLARFARWVHRTNVGTGNTAYYSAKVSADNGATFTEVEHLEANVSRWTEREIDLSAYVTPTAQMKLRFEGYDKARFAQSGMPLTEVLVDDVSLVRRAAACAAFAPGETLPPANVGPTLVVERAGADVVLHWGTPPEDATHGPARFFPVYRAAIGGSFAAAGEPCACGWHDLEAAAPAYGNYQYLIAARNAAGTSSEAPAP